MSRRLQLKDSIRSDRSAQAVMRVVRDPATWPTWQSEIISTQGPAPLDIGDEVLGKAKMLGFEVQGRSEATSVDDQHFVEDVVVGVRLIVTYSVAEHAGGCTITRTVETELPGGPLGRLLSLPLRRRLKKMQVQVLHALADQASEGS
ncbi:MAG TPA: SRPBCC family protein [Actinomycetota bacterium]|nr:SRPBCC family protein [Actinomycetota bacterium]